jgi:hypothetical protein
MIGGKMLPWLQERIKRWTKPSSLPYSVFCVFSLDKDWK